MTVNLENAIVTTQDKARVIDAENVSIVDGASILSSLSGVSIPLSSELVAKTQCGRTQ